MRNNQMGVLAVALIATTLSARGLDFAVARDVAYSDASPRCTLDVMSPVGVSNAAVVVNFHGGGLSCGEKGFAPWPKERRGLDPVCFVAANYRLLTNAAPADCIADAAAAVAWTIRNAAAHGGDPKKVFVTGVSAGGYLSAMLGLDPKWLAAHGLKPTDLAGIIPLTGQMTKHFNVRRLGFKDVTPQFRPVVDAWAPLAHAAKDGVPPVCFAAGGRDAEWPARVEENELLAASMRALGNRAVEFHETEGSHGGGVTPSSYFLRDFVMRTVDTRGVSRFARGERVAFLGDSITHDGRFVGYLQLFAALRHPGWNVRCSNAGISGDVAAGGLARWEWDVLAFKPDRTFVMFGMNDVGRENYKTSAPAPAVVQARADALARYEASQSRLAEKILASGVKAVIMTPSPYDQYSDASPDNLAACNEPGLAACAAICRRLADRHALGTVDFHARLTEILRSHPELHLCGRDRVHPGSQGHLLMAALILEEMGEGATVARVILDAKKGVALPIGDKGVRNAVVTAVTASPEAVAFTYAPKALPFPALDEYKADEKVYPLTERFNQEVLCVTGLAAGAYDLAFDGERVGSFTADDFARGVNVALLDTPNQRRAKDAAKLVARLVANENDRRMVAIYYVEFANAKISRTDYPAQDAYIERRLANMKAAKSPWYEAHVSIADIYRKNRGRMAEFTATAEDLFERINAVRPAVSRVTIRRRKGQ